MANTIGIDISTAELMNAATKISTLNDKLSDRLEEIKNQMHSLSNTWSSDASTTIKNNFDALYKRTADYKAVVESYWKFLNATAKQYEDIELALNNNANAFK